MTASDQTDLTPDQIRVLADTLLRLGGINVDDPWIRGHLHNAGLRHAGQATVDAIRQQMRTANVTITWPANPTAWPTLYERDRQVPHNWEAFDPDTRRRIGEWFVAVMRAHEEDGDEQTARHATWAASVFGAFENEEGDDADG